VSRFGTRISLDDGAELDGLSSLPDDIRLIQFRRGLSDARYRHLAALLGARPDVGLRAYASPDIVDLEFLRFFRALRHFQVDAIWDLGSLDGLRHLPDSLETLGIGGTRRPLSLAPLRRFRELRSLAVEGRHRNLDAIGTLTALETLHIRSVPMPDLALLRPFQALRSLDLKLGGTTDLGLLPSIGQLDRLELWQIRGLTDISPIGDTVTLEELFLQSLPQVRRLPDLSRMANLRRVTLHTMKGIRDLTPLTAAPTLEQLLLVAMPQLRPESLRPLVGHPTLRRGLWNIGSLRKTFEAHDVLPIAPEPFGYREWQAGVPYRTILKAWLAAVQKGTHEVDGRMVVTAS